MCLSLGTIASMGLAAGGALYSGKVARGTAKDQAEEFARQRAETNEAAKEEAKRMRKLGDRQAGAARAALAASGVDVDQGTAININEDITRRAEEDAHQILLTGKRRSDSLTRSGANAIRSGRQASYASVLTAGGQIAEGWVNAKRHEEFMK